MNRSAPDLLRRTLVLALTTLALALPARAQFSSTPSPEELVRASAAPVKLDAGGRGEAVVTLKVLDGWHINANPAGNDFMIPTEVELSPAGGVAAGAPRYPEPELVTLSFDPQPQKVWSHEVAIRLPLSAAAGATGGTIQGVVRFQGCNDQLCLPPAKVPFTVAVTVAGGIPAAGGAPGGPPDTLARTTPDSAAGGAAPGGANPLQSFGGTPPGAGQPNQALDNPLVGKLRGLSPWAYYPFLLLIGLGLNLTPCVFPMLGMTAAVFGGRRTGKPRQAFPYALLYVLGMAATYSALGLLAAFTGSLFGSFLQNPLVLAGIGVLMIALALAPLGLYTFQPPAWLLSSLGGAQGTSAVGVFLSGLVVGVFAAPCIGPPVVALLALVAAVGSPWFGFASLFTVAVGLGLPYLLLGTFSGLLQKLPRSGEWMVWVEHLLGLVLLALGGYFLALAFMPDLAEWVMPAALVLGGLYLGFLDRNGNALPHFRTFKRLAGVAAVIGAVAIGSQLTAQGLEFSPVTESELAAAVAGGQPVMIDFSADWCVPCHELENFTFTDRRVIGEARAFRTFKVDLTRYDSPEAEAWRKRYGITGVPTIVFLGPDGAEIRPARVEGFMPAQPFVERMRLAAAAWKGPRG